MRNIIAYQIVCPFIQASRDIIFTKVLLSTKPKAFKYAKVSSGGKHSFASILSICRPYEKDMGRFKWQTVHPTNIAMLS